MSAPGSNPGAAEPAKPSSAALPPRVVARRRAESAGPTLLVIAGIHGNEPAGVRAAHRVLARLDASAGVARGELVVLLGNRGAFARGVRFVQRDLNRQWTAERVERLREDSANPAVALGPEDREQLELIEAIDEAIAAARGPVYVVDLHTTSAEGIPFAMIGERLRLRSFALNFPLPTLLGLLGKIGGTLLEYLTARGCLAIGVEGGQHQAETSAAHHEAVLWIALAATGLVAEGFPPDLPAQRERLERAWRDLPRAIRVDHRHPIEPADQFVMQPGFVNLQRVRRGTLLACDARGEIRAKRDGVLVMPLYQKLGDDGFFLGREILQPLFRLGAWWGRFAAALLIAGLALTGAAGRSVASPRPAFCLAIFSCPAAAESALFFGPNVARVVADEHVKFNAFTAREVISQQSAHATTEFETVNVSVSFGEGAGWHWLAPDGSGIALAWTADSSHARVAVCEVRHGRPAGIPGVTDLGHHETLLVSISFEGNPCVGVLRVIPIELSEQQTIGAGAHYDPHAPNLVVGEAEPEIRGVLARALGK